MSRWAKIPSAWILAHPRWRLYHVRASRLWSHSARSWRPIPEKSDACSARWIASVGLIIPTIMMDKAVSRRARLHWKESKRYKATRRQHAHTERRLAAHRKSLHGHLAHRITQVGTTIHIENNIVFSLAEAVWSKHRASLTGAVCSAFGPPGCKNWRHPGWKFLLTRLNCVSIATSVDNIKKATVTTVAQLSCGLGPVQRDLYSAFLLAYLEPEQNTPPSLSTSGKVRSRACEP